MSSTADQQAARINDLNNGVVQQGVPEKYLQKAVVTLPSGAVQNFFVHKKSKGNVLTDLVSEHEGLLEKDYFGLNYVDHFGEKTWLYPDKRIAKQLKNASWNFTLRVKFYAPEPSVLADDLTRYLLYLQVRKDVYDETLPTSYATKILLAAIVMQAETGDFETTQQSPEEYDHFVRNAHLVASVDQEFLAKVREAHKEQKGLTTQEAHLKYLDVAKALAKYGYTFFQGKDAKGGNVTVGVHAHGITVYKDSVQIHKFLWQSIEKIQFSSNKFSILLKPGELDEKKQVTVRYQMPDYYTAKRLYRTAVEHHTFFRLIKPEDPPKSGLLSRVGSEHFRYQGRTYFQAKMASQMFDNPTTTVQRTPSGRQVSRSVDDLAIQRSFPASPLHYADETTHQATSPEKSKSYSLSSKHKDERTPLSVVVHETNGASPGSKRSSTSSASIVSPFSGEYIVSSRPYTPRDEATTSPYEDVVFPLAISPTERQRNLRTPTKSTASASTSQRNSRVRFFEGPGPVTPDDGSAVAMAPAGKPGKRTAKRRLFGPVNDDHTAFSPVDDLYRSPEIVDVPLDSKVSVYDRGWYTATLPSTSAQQSVPFFVCCKPTKAVRREYDILRDFGGVVDQSNLHKRNELEAYPLRYYSAVYHSGLPPTKRRKWAITKDEDVVPADRLNPEYYAFTSDRDYSPGRFERVTDAETIPLRQVSQVYWHGGQSKPNTKVVDVAPESRVVRTTTVQQRTEPLSSTEVVERSYVERDQPVHEVKTTTIERSGQPGDEYTITTTRIETTTVIESDVAPSTSEEYVPPPKPVVKERTPSKYTAITEAYEGPLEPIPKTRELDLMPIKRFSNVYHPGVSEERVTPITWIRKQKTTFLDRRRDSNRPTVSETSESSFQSKSTHHEKIVSRKRLHSLSQHYPVIGEAYEGVVFTISPTTEAPSANLFDCVSFVSEDEAGPSESPASKKAARSSKYSLPRCVCGWCGPQERHLIEDQYPYDAEPYTGPVTALVHDGQLTHAELETCVNFQTEEAPEHVDEEPEKVQIVQQIPTISIHKEPSIHESDTDEDIPTISGVEYDMSIDMHRPSDVAYVECVIETSAPRINVTFESRSESEQEFQSVVNTQTTLTREKIESDIQEEIENVEPVQSSVVIERRPSTPIVVEPQPIHVIDYELSRIDSRRVKFDPETSAKPLAKPKDELITEEVSNPVHESSLHQKRIAADEGCGLFCGTSKKAIQEDPYDVTDAIDEAATKKKSPNVLSKNYPVIGSDRFEGEHAELLRQPEAKSVDLFDAISFVSGSEDSGVGGDTNSQRPKPKKSGLKCLWCGPSKSQRKSSKESLKVVNVHEQQIQRRNISKKADTYSLSEHYPVVGEAYSGEVVTLNKAELAPEASLFDLIDFVPSVSKATSIQSLQHKKTGLKCLWCGPSKSQRDSNNAESTASRKHSKNTCVPRCLGRQSDESKYPVDAEPYVGPIYDLNRPAEAPSANLFDTISFATDDGDRVSLQLHNNGDLRRASIEVQPEIPIPVVTVQERRQESDNVEMVFVHKVQSPEPKPSTSFEADVQENEDQNRDTTHSDILLYKRMDEVVDIAVPSTSAQIEEPFVPARTPTPPAERQVAADKGCGLWCGGRNKAVNEPYDGTRRLSHHESIVKAKKAHSLSKNYPVIGDRFEGEHADLPRQPEAKSVDLFDAISFVSSSEDSGVGGDTTAERPKPKKSGLKCLWCGPSKSQRKSSEESLKVVNVHEQQVQRRNVTKKAETFSLSEHYPTAEAAYEGEVVTLNKAELAPEANLFDLIEFVPSTEAINVKRGSDHVHGGLRCLPCVGKSSQKPTEGRVSHHESIVKAKKAHSLSQNYPVIGESFEGEHVDLPRQPEAKSADLFDTISFVSGSEDSGVGGDTTVERTKPKKSGLKCLWCGPSKSQRKTSEESLKAVNVHEQQVQRNRFVRKARTYSTSEHYPFVQVPYEGEVFEIAKATEIPAVNLFDAISFAPSTDEEQPVVEASPKKTKSPKCGLLCAPCLGRRSTLPEAEVEVEPEPLVIRERLPSVEEHVAKVEVRPVTPVEIAPVEITESVTKREIVVEPVIEVERVVEKVEIETVQRPREPSISAGYPVITEPYSGSLQDLQKDSEAPGANLFEHVEFVQQPIEVVDIAVPSTSAQIEEPFVPARTPTPPAERQVAADKGCGLWCGGRNKAVDEPYDGTRRLSHHESIVKAKKAHSLSKNYPVIGDRFEGEHADLPRQPEAKSVDLFDAISFVSSSEDSGVGGDTTAERPKPKKSGLKCLWCGPSKSQRKSSEESLKVVNVHEQQVQRRNVTKKAETFSLSEHYPTAEAAYEGEVVTLNKAELAPEANLFDLIEFVPSTEAINVKRDSDHVHGGLRCLPCVGKSSQKPTERRLSKAKNAHPLSQNYPVIGESFEGEHVDLPRQPEAKSADLFDTISFVSGSEDSGVGGDTTVERTKPKKSGLKCLWCGPSKSQRKTSEESLKAVNVHEQQVQRNRFVRKARTYSTSEHYPSVQVPYEGEVFEIAKATEIPAVNLFDAISFAPSTDEEQPVVEASPKKTKSPKCGLLCAPCLGRRSTLPEAEVEVEPEPLVIRERLPSVEEHVAKVEVRPVTPVEIAPVEITESVTKREIVVEPVIEVERVVEKVEIETVQRPREPSISAGYPVITEPYSGSLQDLQKDSEAPGANLFEHVEFVQQPIEVVDIAVPSTSAQIEEPFVPARTPTPPAERQVAADKGCGLWCGGRNKAVDEPYDGTRRLSHHESIVKAKKAHSLSKNYPVIGDRFEGEHADLPRQPEAKSVDLFDAISFVSSSEDSGVGGDTTAERPKPKKSGLKCLWCGPSKSQRKSSEESLKVVNVHEQQVQRRNVTKKAETFSLSEHYPTAEAAYEGEVVTLNKAELAPEANLFDLIEFVPSTEAINVKRDSDHVHGGLRCLPCVGKSSQKPTERRLSKAKKAHPLSQNYPVIGESFEGEHVDLPRQPEAKSADLFDTISFVSGSEDSGVGGDTTVERTKPKKSGLKCLWCGPSKSQRKTSEESLKAVNVHEQQVQRNRFVRKARTYSTSEHYPSVQVPYEGEVFEIAKATEIPAVNLFDAISFAPSTDEEQPVVEASPKKTKSPKCGLLCAPCLGRRSTLPEAEVEVEPEPLVIRERLPSVEEHVAKVEVRPVTPVEIAPVEIAPVEITESVTKREIVVEPVIEVERVVEKVEIETVQRPREPSISAGYPVITEPYSGSLQDLQKDSEAPGANLFEHVEFVQQPIEVVDIAVPSTSAQIEEPFVPARTPTPPAERQVAADKGCGLWCGGRNKAVDEPYDGTRRLSHHESIVKAKKAHSLSKNYPVIGDRFEGEHADLPRQPEAKSVDLFDAISFVSSSEDSGVGGDTTAERPKPKKSGLKCLWCGPSKSQRKSSEESLKVVNVHEQQVQRRNVTKKADTFSLSAHYPVVEEAYSGEVVTLNKAELAPEANLFDLIEFVPSTEAINVKRGLDHVHGGLRCLPCVGKSSQKPTERRLSKAKKAHPLSQNYPVIGESFEGEHVDLPRQPEAKSADLFDTISFVSGSEDSGVGGDTTVERTKPKKSGLKCLWCGPSKSQRKTSEESLKAVNVHEQQVQRNRFVRKARTYSTSEHYPSVQVPYEGEVFEIAKATEIPAVNLFDAISFAPSTDEEQPVVEASPKKTKSPKCGLLCAPCLGRRSTLPEAEVEVEPEPLVIRERLPSVEEHVAKVEVRPVTPVEIAPVEIAPVEITESVTKREIVVEPVIEVERVVEKVEIETVQRPREPSISAGYPVITEPYSGSLQDLQKDSEAPGANLFEHVEFVQQPIEVVDIAVPSTSAQIEEPFVPARTPTPPAERQVAADKGCGLWCGGRNKAVDEPYDGTRRLSHHESIVKAKKAHSLSKNYPVIGDRFEGEHADLPRQPEAKSVDLFDAISFVSSSEDSGVGGDTTAERPKPKKSGLKCLWCGPSKSQRKSSEESLKVVNVHEQQVQRRNVTKKADTFSLSAHYPVVEEAYSGEVVTLNKAELAPEANLFDLIEFVPSTEAINVKRGLDHVHGGLRCLPCVGKSSQKPTERRLSKAKKAHPLSQNYPVIGESFEGEHVDLPRQPEAKSADLFDTISFVSGSEDSGVGGDTTVERTKPKKSGLKCLWCGPSKSQRKTSEESLKAVNVHEQQVQRNRFVRKARTYSTSEHYPSVQVPYEGEVFEIAKATEIPAVNLFDAISFAPSTDEEQPVVEASPKKTKSPKCGLLCAPCLGRRSTLPEAEVEVEPEPLVIRERLPSVEEHVAKVEVRPVTPVEIAPVEIAPVEITESVTKREIVVEPVIEVERVVEKVEIETVQRPREPSISAGYPVITEPYSGSLQDLQKDSEAPGANLFEHVEFVQQPIEVVDIAVPSTSAQIEEPFVPARTPTPPAERQVAADKGCGLWCGGRNKAVDEPYDGTRRLSHHESIVKAKKAHSLSKNYPVIGDRFEGEHADLPRQPEAKSVDLFDAISFVSSSEDSGVGGDTTAERPKPKKSGLKCLWCGPSKSQRKSSEESLKVVNVHEQQVQRRNVTKKANTFSLSAHYPVVEEAYSGEVVTLNKAELAPEANLFDLIEFVPSTEAINVKRGLDHVHGGLRCLPCVGKSSQKPTERRLSKAKKAHPLSQNYPVIGESFEGEHVDLPRQPEAKSADLFDTISFVSGSEDSGVGGDTTVERTKPKKSGLKCLWCGPSKSQRKTSEESLKAVNVHEQQVQRNRFVRKARTYSTSEHYPSVQVPYEGEVFEIAKATEIPAVNLFDAISFAPSTDEEQPVVEASPKKTKSPKCGLLCAPCLGRRSTLPEAEVEVEPEPLVIRERLPSVEEHVAKVEVRPVTPVEIAPVEIAPVEITESVTKREIVVEPVIEVERVVEKVEIETVQRPREPSISAGYPGITEPYSGSLQDLQKDSEAPGANLFEHVEFVQQPIEVVDIAVPSTSAQIEEPFVPARTPTPPAERQVAADKGCGLWCGGRNKAVDEPYDGTRRLSHHESIVKAKKAHSLSKNYPVIGDRFEGEHADLPRQPEAKSVDLFDAISFVSSSEDSGVGGDTTAERPKPKKSGLKCLWCGPSKSQRKSSEESLKVVNVHEQQVQRRNVTKKADTYSLSAHYPVVEEAYSGEVVTLNKAELAPEANLFDLIDFVPYTEEINVKRDSDHVHGKLRCLPCVGKSSQKPTERRLSKAKKAHSLSQNYPVIGESFEGEHVDLPRQPEAKSADLFDTITFVSGSEDSGAGGDTTAERTKPKKSGLECLWCGPSKSQRKTSEESQKAINVHEQQIQRRNVTKRAETWPLSDHYPVIEEAYLGEVVALGKTELAPEANLFDLIDFVPSTIKATTTTSSDNVQGGFRCIPCVGKTPRDLTDRRLLFGPASGYPAICEPYTGEVDVLKPNVEASSADLFDCVEFAPSDEIFAQPGYNRDTLKSKTSTLEKDFGTVRRLRLFKSRAKTDTSPVDYSSYPGYFAYDGPVKNVERSADFESTPLRQHVSVYHSGRPVVASKFTRERLPGIEEIGEPTGSYAVCEIREGEVVPLHAFASLDTVPLAEHAKRPVVSQSEKISSGNFKRKYSKTRNVTDTDGDSSSQSSDELPKSSFKRKREEGEGFFTFFRNRIGTRAQKKTGFEGLMVPDESNVKSTVLEGDLPSHSIHEHVHVYHPGFSNLHQTIDSGFEDTSETDVKRGGTLTWRQSGRFFDKFKRGTKRPSADEQEKPESVVEVKTPPVSTHYEHLDQTPYLGLYSSTELNVDPDQVPLSTAVDQIPIGHYPGHAPVPIEFVVPTQKSVIIEHQQPSTSAKSTLVKRFSKDSRQDRDPHYAYGLSSAKFEGDHSIVNKDSDAPEHPIGEFVTVYHCGKSDVPTTPVPADFYEVSPERTVSTQYPNSTPTSEFESIAETNVTLERSPVTAYGQVIITDSDRTEAAMTSYSIDESAFEDAITSTPRAEELSAEPLREQTIVYHSGRSSSRDASERNELVADTSADRERRDLVQRIIAIFRRNPRVLEGYPEITDVCKYDGPLAEFTRTDDLDQNDLHTLANVYHSGCSDDKASKKARKNAEKQRRRALRKLKVNLNDYPHDDEPVDDAHVFNLYAIRDVPQSPAPATLPADTFYSRRSHPRHRFLRRFRRSRQPRASELAIALRDAPSRRDDYSTGTFSMVISDKSLFTRGHWPVTDIDVDVVLTKQRHIDCEFETTVATKRAYDSAIAGGPALSRTSHSQESGASTSANWCRVRQHPDGSWFAEVSATLSVPQQKEESVDAAIEVPRGAYVITEDPFDYEVDLCSLVDLDDDKVVSEPGVGEASDCGLSSKFGDSLTRLSLASDDDDSIMFTAITRRLSEKLSKKTKKEEEKRRKKEEKEAAKRAKKDKSKAGATKKRTSGAGDADSVSSSSSSSDSDAEHEERHVVVSQAVAGPVEPLSRNQELGDLHGIPESRQITMAPQTAAVNHVDANSSGPYTPAKDKDGRVIREETVEQVYRISGSGKVPKFDPTDMSLQAAVDKCVRDTDKVPRVQMVEANILVKENEPLPQALREGSAPHTTVHTWHETEAGPEKVTTEVDKYGNKVTRTVKTQHTKHTIQKQSYQTYAIDGTPVPEQQTVIETTEETSPLGSDAVARSPVVHTKTRTVAYEKGSHEEPAEPHGELVSSKTITTGNRTVEILTYKTEKDGVIETRVEHRVTIHSGSDIDHDAELAKALLEATEMSPDLLINRVEVEKSTQN